MSRKKIYLNIGTQKTGTSALIYFFLRNLEELERQGVCFPHPWFEINPAQQIFVNAFSCYLFPQYENKLSFHVPDRLVMSSYRRIVNKHKFDKCCIINGRFYSYRNKTDVSKLKKFFENDEVRIVVYLLRQDEFVEKYYRQILKQLVPETTNFSEFVKVPGLLKWLNYKESLKPWIEIFGSENVEIRLYDNCTLERGVIDDFCEFSGIELNSKFILPQDRGKTNKRLPAELLEFLRIAKSVNLDEPTRRKLEKWAAINANKYERGSILQYFTDNEREIFLRQFRECNSWVEERTSSVIKAVDTKPLSNSTENLVRKCGELLTNEDIAGYNYDFLQSELQAPASQKGTLKFLKEIESRALKLKILTKLWSV